MKAAKAEAKADSTATKCSADKAVAAITGKADAKADPKDAADSESGSDDDEAEDSTKKELAKAKAKTAKVVSAILDNVKASRGKKGKKEAAKKVAALLSSAKAAETEAATAKVAAIVNQAGLSGAQPPPWPSGLRPGASRSPSAWRGWSSTSAWKPQRCAGGEPGGRSTDLWVAAVRSLWRASTCLRARRKRPGEPQGPPSCSPGRSGSAHAALRAAGFARSPRG